MGVLRVLALGDYRLLLTANVAEFCGSTLAELALLIFLYDATGSAIALGGLGGAFVLPISFGFCRNSVNSRLVFSHLTSDRFLQL